MCNWFKKLFGDGKKEDKSAQQPEMPTEAQEPSAPTEEGARKED